MVLTSWLHLDIDWRFQKCKVHLCVLKGFRIAAHQSWHILRVVQELNPGRAGHINVLARVRFLDKVCAIFDELQF